MTETDVQLTDFFDHTILNPNATKADIIRACEEAKHYNFKMIATNSVHCKLCKEI